MSKIKITFPDGAVKEFESGTSGYQIAKSISQRLADEVLAIKFNDVIKDLNRPLTEDGSVKFLTFDDPEG
ncbi:MAG TPA: TGS domain-containing protein, partial [Ignavibacteriaceae bacterium]